MKTHFIGEDIEVRFEHQPGPPSAFVWRGAEYPISKVEQASLVIDRNRRWWQRRHRDIYVVRTASGEVFKLYRHRGPGKRYWRLVERIEEGDA